MTAPTPSPRPLIYAGRSSGLSSRWTRRLIWVTIVIAALAVVGLVLRDRGGGNYATIPLSNFYSELRTGHVQRLYIDGNEIVGSLSVSQIINGRKVSDFRTVLPSGTAGDWRFLQWLLENSNQATIEAEQDNGVLTNFILPLIPWLLIFGILWLFVFRLFRRPRQPIPVVLVNPVGQ